MKGGLDAHVELLYITQAAVFVPLSGVEVEKGVLIPVVFTLDYFGFSSRRGKDHPVIPGNSGKLCFVGVDFERGDLECIYVFEQTCGIGITFQLAVGSTVFCVQIAVCFEPFCRLYIEPLLAQNFGVIVDVFDWWGGIFYDLGIPSGSRVSKPKLKITIGNDAS